MDIQLKRGLLEICVLTAIGREDSYGYKIVQDLEKVIGISESTLYPILRRLESAGALTVYSVEHGGRLRKYYRITAVGRARIGQFLADWEGLARAYAYIKEENRSHEEN